MKVKPKNLNKKQTIEVLDALYTAAGSVQGRDAMKLFLRDLLTPSERIMLGRRILIAKQLLAGKPYEDIQKDLQVGSDPGQFPAGGDQRRPPHPGAGQHRAAG